MVSHSMYGMKRAVHKTSDSELINNIFLFLFYPINFLYLISKVERYQWCCMQPLGLYLKNAQALLCHIPCVVI